MRNSIPAVHSAEQLDEIIRLSSRKLNLHDSLTLGTQLVIHGQNEIAHKFIAARKSEYSNRHVATYLDGLDRLNRNISIYQVAEFMKNNKNFAEQLLSFKPTYVKSTNRDRLIIVFATAWNNFGLSFPVLHSILIKYPVSVLYIKNPDAGMYCNGYIGLGGTIDEMAESLVKLKRSAGYKSVTVLGFSSGGYASLFAAGALAADAYIGFGIRTDWSQDCKIPGSPSRTSPALENYNTNTLTNLANHKSMARISKATIYFGSLDDSDCSHAKNMISLRNFSIVPVAKSSHHVVLHLMTEGVLEQSLQPGL